MTKAKNNLVSGRKLQRIDFSSLNCVFACEDSRFAVGFPRIRHCFGIFGGVRHAESHRGAILRRFGVRFGGVRGWFIGVGRDVFQRSVLWSLGAFRPLAAYCWVAERSAEPDGLRVRGRSGNRFWES